MELVFQIASEFLVFFGISIESDAFKRDVCDDEHKVWEVDHHYILELFGSLVCDIAFRFDMVNLMTFITQIVLIKDLIALIRDAWVQPFAEILHLVKTTFV